MCSTRLAVPLPAISVLFLLAFLALNGCSQTTTPTDVADDPSNGGQQFEGSIDPTAGTFLLQSIETPVPDGAPVRVDLIGSELAVDQTGEVVGLKVAIRNADTRPLHPRIEVTASRFVPSSVRILESDWTNCPPDSTGQIPAGGCVYGFDYSEYIGDNEVLEPGEISAPRTWAFHVPGLTPFTFGATARVSLVPVGPVIAGVFFTDENRNGQLDHGEQPFHGGWVLVTGPDGYEMEARVGEEGRYAVPIEQSGLYSVTGFPPPTFGGFAPVEFTTPNPLEVVILPGPDGEPQSFRHAHFGLANVLLPGVCPPVIILYSKRDSIPFDQYNLIEIELDDRFLKLHVGFSGCGPEHPFQLFMVSGFMESLPVQVRLQLAHDDLGELCAAAWERHLCFDLEPIREAYRRSSGSSGSIILRFVDWHGEVHSFELAVP